MSIFSLWPATRDRIRGVQILKPIDQRAIDRETLIQRILDGNEPTEEEITSVVLNESTKFIPKCPINEDHIGVVRISKAPDGQDSRHDHQCGQCGETFIGKIPADVREIQKQFLIKAIELAMQDRADIALVATLPDVLAAANAAREKREAPWREIDRLTKLAKAADPELEMACYEADGVVNRVKAAEGRLALRPASRLSPVERQIIDLNKQSGEKALRVQELKSDLLGTDHSHPLSGPVWGTTASKIHKFVRLCFPSVEAHSVKSLQEINPLIHKPKKVVSDRATCREIGDYELFKSFWVRDVEPRLQLIEKLTAEIAGIDAQIAKLRG